MNNKGFTLVELLATLVILAIVIGLSLGAFNINLGDSKKKTEEVFVDTLRDAVDMYLSSEFDTLEKADKCGNDISKKYKSDVKVYKYVKKIDKNKLTFNDLFDSSYKPLVKSEFVNPANKDVEGKYNCDENAVINVYRDEDFVYYYSIEKDDLKCLNNIGDGYDTVISNLPEGYSCE